jgi:HEAT repeat-containing protein 5
MQTILSQRLPDPPPTEVVNSAISLFAVTFPLQSSKIQETILEQLSSFLSASCLQRDPARKAAMTVNIATALFLTLTVVSKGPPGTVGALRSSIVEKSIQDLLHVSEKLRVGKAFTHFCSLSSKALMPRFGM